MRAFFRVAIYLIFTMNILYAQSNGDSSVYNPGIRMLKNAKTMDDYFMCATRLKIDPECETFFLNCSIC
ncbi:MAG: hypothetical protein JW830_02045 [Bacteroidales bacterium]|nr:hypothetical protein [Bacteroidales bacterium]